VSVEDVKKYIDYLAMFKMNYFHWHLVDDQGWRIEIKKYPKLTEIGSKRKNTLIGHGGIQPFGFDSIPHYGFYTQQEIKEIVDYANRRGVEIIPEIELPGHSQAAIASYPFLGCTSDAVEVWNQWGVSPYIYKITSEKIQAQMKSLGIENEEELQAYFIRRMSNFLKSKNKILIGWDEILYGGAPDNSVIMYWRAWINEKNPAIIAVENNHKVILTPSSHSYFDHYQSKDSSEPLAIGGYNPVDTVYLKSHLPKGFPKDKIDLVWGIQANVWTEYMKDFNHIEYMIFPRMPALAEVLWTDKEQQNLNDFKNRFKILSKYFDRIEVNYAKHDFE
jgi:hexosaminidase